MAERGLVHQPILAQALRDALDRVTELQQTADQDAHVVQQGGQWMALAADEAFLHEQMLVKAEGDFDLHRAAGSEEIKVLDFAGDLRATIWEFFTGHHSGPKLVKGRGLKAPGANSSR